MKRLTDKGLVDIEARLTAMAQLIPGPGEYMQATGHVYVDWFKHAPQDIANLLFEVRRLRKRGTERGTSKRA